MRGLFIQSKTLVFFHNAQLVSSGKSLVFPCRHSFLISLLACGCMLPDVDIFRVRRAVGAAPGSDASHD